MADRFELRALRDVLLVLAPDSVVTKEATHEIAKVEAALNAAEILNAVMKNHDIGEYGNAQFHLDKALVALKEEK